MRYLFALPALCLTATAGASVVDLTSAFTSGSINGAIFSTDSSHAAGTGFIDSFVRVRRTGTESGYNTSVPSQLFGRDEVAGNFTHDIQLGDLGVITVSNVDYYQFFLDINEPSGGNAPLITLDDVQIYTNPTAHATYHMDLTELGTPAYTMDGGGDNSVELDYDLNPQLQGPGGGSGTGDMVMLVPTSYFPSDPTTYVYLYSHFGTPQASGDGFEEWWTVGAIPAPSAAVLGLLTLGGLAGRRRRA